MNTPRRRLEKPGRRTRRIAAAAAAGLALVAVLITLLVSGSAQDPDPAANPGQGAETTAGTGGSASASPTATASTDPDSTATPSTLPDEDEDAIRTPTELEPFALRGSDLPTGWRTLDAAGPATAKLIGSCLVKATTPSVPHVLNTGSFRSGSEGPVLTSTLRDFATPEQSTRAWSEVRSAVLACARGTSKPSLKTVSLTSKADASVAVGFTITEQGYSARGELLVARVGVRSVTLTMIGLTQKDLDLGRDALRTVIARLD